LVTSALSAPNSLGKLIVVFSLKTSHMRYLLLLLIAIPCVLQAQSIYLLDRNLIEPFKTVETVTIKDVTTGSFPVYALDVTSIIHAIDSCVVQWRRMPDKKGFAMIAIGKSTMVVNKDQHYYSLVLNTKTDAFSTPFVIVKTTDKTTALKRMMMVADYLKNNNAISRL
jgi:hypothetical protein